MDDNFIGNKGYLKNHLLPALIQWQKDGKEIPFNTEASVNLADDEPLMEMMVKAGFDAVFIGIETPNEESLAECNKQLNCELGSDQVNLLISSGIYPQHLLYLGLYRSFWG